MKKLLGSAIFLIATIIISSCSGDGSSIQESDSSSLPEDDIEQLAVTGKWGLWSSGVTMLRGANVFQRRTYPDLDNGWIGDGPFGPPYTQESFYLLASLGANYVNISHPGLYSEEAPYGVDEAAVANLDSLLAMTEAADMFAVITFRTGPGRNEFVISGGDNPDWPKSRAVSTVWTDADVQDAWMEMWRYTAERYRDSGVVVGYDLMCEPHPEYILFGVYEPEGYYPANADSLSDWNRLHPRIAAAIREVDSKTPIIVGGMNWSSALWMPYLKITGVELTVYAVHQYEPRYYTHQEPGADIAYPGRGSLSKAISQVDEFRLANGAPPVTANEYGVSRFAPSAPTFMADQMALFEERGMNHALWDWVTPYPTMHHHDDNMDIMHGPDPDNHTDVENELRSTVVSNWSLNTARPSNTSFARSARR